MPGNVSTFVDLFCGAGGLSLGLEMAGLHCSLAIDNNPAAIESFLANHTSIAIRSEITPEIELPYADVYVGGPPCQGFSSAGMRKHGDKRNSLVTVYANLIVANLPSVFVFENVEGFLTYSHGERVVDLLEPLVSAGYRIILRKVNAANYGIPQHRKRVLAIGALHRQPIFPEATTMAFGSPGSHRVHANLPKAPTFLDAVSDLGSPSSEPPGFPTEHYCRLLSESDKKRIRLLKPGQTMRDLPEELWHESYRKRANRRVMDGMPTEKRGGAPAGIRRLKGNEPCKAITSGAVGEFIHPIEDRYLTIRECARIQTFPDSYLFCGTASEKILQIGNAVPPMLGREIGKAIQAILEQAPDYTLSGGVVDFRPTHANGMSPALQKCVERVQHRFGLSTEEMEQLTLWG
jgi:DNA (cytosine-5)-methyltransferase 1